MANAIISANAPQLNVVDGLPVVSSLALADHFEKEHRGVLRDIRLISEELPEDLRTHNFVLSSYDGKTPNGGKRTYPMYLLTRDGFTLVAMGFTGKKALAWKVKYIQAFNAMEMELAKMTAPKRKSKALGHGIKSLPSGKQEIAESPIQARIIEKFPKDMGAGRKQALKRIEDILKQFYGLRDTMRLCVHPGGYSCGRSASEKDRYDILMSLYHAADANLAAAYNALEAGYRMGREIGRG